MYYRETQPRLQEPGRNPKRLKVARSQVGRMAEPRAWTICSYAVIRGTISCSTWQSAMAGMRSSMYLSQDHSQFMRAVRLTAAILLL
jgi:hypothetical protein